MSISILNNIFSLETQNSQYVVGIDKYGYNHCLHWGKKCDISDFVIEDIGDENSNHSMADAFKQELTVFGGTMYRDCGVKATFADGCREIELDYAGFENDNNNLKLIFNDKHYPLSVCVNYQICNNSDVIIKWYTVENKGNEKIVLKSFSAANFLCLQKSLMLFKTQTVHGQVSFKSKKYIGNRHSCF